MEIEGYFHLDNGVRTTPLIIAEVGVNHNGRMDLARQLIDRAAESGADAVKFQAFIPERMIVKGTPKVSYQSAATSVTEDQYEMLKRFQLSAEQFRDLKKHAEANGLIFLCSVFDRDSSAALNDLGVLLFKIPSGELTNLPLVEQVAQYGKPMLISTGMAGLGEVEAAVQVAEEAGNRRLLLLHCVSQYPASLGSLNLKALLTLSQAFQLPVGFSDHSDGIMAAIISIAFGAVVVEKHFTLSRRLEGPDHQASLEPEQFRQLVQAIRDTKMALGDGCKRIASIEMETRSLTRKSIVAATEILQGTLITLDHLDFKRPGNGITPGLLREVLGKRAAHAIKKDDLFRWTDLE